MDLVASLQPMVSDPGDRPATPSASTLGFELLSLGAGERLFHRFEPLDTAEVREYREEQYPGWLKDLRSRIETLPGVLSRRSRYRDVRFQLSNMGNVPASGVVVQFRALGGLQFLPPNMKLGSAASTRSTPCCHSRK
jgi:hypothetical protein